jgi:hypothetical protein
MPRYVNHLLELLIIIVERYCAIHEVGAEVQAIFEHRARKEGKMARSCEGSDELSGPKNL